MKAIDILQELANEVSYVRHLNCSVHYGYENCMEESGYDPNNFDVIYHDGKIKRLDTVFVTNERLSGKKPNVIMENKEECEVCVYIYKVK